MFFMGPESQAEYKRQVDLNQMQQMEQVHTYYEKWDLLDQEALTFIMGMMNLISFDDNPSATAARFAGFAAGELQRRFNICPGCGEDHDAAVAGLLSPDEAPTETPETPA